MDKEEKIHKEDFAAMMEILLKIPLEGVCCPRHLKLALLLMAYSIDFDYEECVKVLLELRNDTPLLKGVAN